MIAMKRAQQNETEVFIRIRPQRSGANHSPSASWRFVELCNDPKTYSLSDKSESYTEPYAGHGSAEGGSRRMVSTAEKSRI
jgi:hypothetical protein